MTNEEIRGCVAARSVTGTALAAIVLSALTFPALAQSNPERAQRGAAIAAGPPTPEGDMPCMTCHGATGMGDAASGTPRLAGLSAAYIAKQLADFASETRPDQVMTPIAEGLDEEERAAVAAFYAEMEPRMPDVRAVTEADARVVQSGAALWARGDPVSDVQACVACHGGSQAAGHGDIYPEIGGQPADYLAIELRQFQAGERSNDPGALMRSIAVRLTPEQITAVSAYLSEVAP